MLTHYTQDLCIQNIFVPRIFHSSCTLHPLERDEAALGQQANKHWHSDLWGHWGLSEALSHSLRCLGAVRSSLFRSDHWWYLWGHIWYQRFEPGSTVCRENALAPILHPPISIFKKTLKDICLWNCALCLLLYPINHINNNSFYFVFKYFIPESELFISNLKIM